MALGLDIVFFQMTAVFIWTAILPSEFWDNLRRGYREGIWQGKSRLRDWEVRLQQKLKESTEQRFVKVAHLFRKTPVSLKHSPLSQAIVITLVLQCLLWNVRSMTRDVIQFPRSWISFSDAFGLDQRWEMFSRPFTKSGWFVIPGKLADGSDVELFRNQPAVDWQKPKPS